MAELDSYRATMDASITVDTGGITLEIPVNAVVDYASPDRSQGVASIDFVFLQTEVNFVAIEDDFYFTDLETGEWSKGLGNDDVPFIGPEQLLDFGDSDAVYDFRGLSDNGSGTVSGPEEIDGTLAYRLSYSVGDEAEDIGLGEMNVDLWIAAEDRLLHRIEIRGEFAVDDDGGAAPVVPLDDLSGDVELDAVISFSNFNTPVTIEPPAEFAEPDTGDFASIADQLIETPLESGWTSYQLPDGSISVSAPPTWTVTDLSAESIEELVSKSPDLPENLALQLDRLIGSASFKLFGYRQGEPASAEFAPNFTVLGGGKRAGRRPGDPGGAQHLSDRGGAARREQGDSQISGSRRP